MGKQLGDDIRALRKGRGLTLQALADAVGRSVGWLSQVERGQTEPSVRDLGRVADEFGVAISFFFRSSSRDEAERGLILRAADHMPIGSSDTGLVEELLSPSLSGAFEMIRSTFAPGASSGGSITPRSPQREDGGVLIEGRLILTIAERSFDLAPGDSFQFKGPYAWENPGESPAVVLWVISPPVY